MNVNIPVGVSSFSEIRKNGYYYVDKTGLISEILQTSGTKVTLITRPRRFGKTLAMDMLAEFFDIRMDSRELFNGLEILKNTELCNEWMNKWPVIFVSFKRVEGLNFKDAYDMLTIVFSELYKMHLYLLESDKINKFDKKLILRIVEGSASEKEIKDGLMLLVRTMSIYYEKPVVLIIDEYDVPVSKAENNGYYLQMLDIMKGIMQSLKDNQYLKFAVVTGCLKITKESIFTGTNNFVSNTISSYYLNEYFGFTQNEIYKLLSDMNLVDYFEDIKKWYDGYCFGNMEIYCPWDVMNYMRDLQLNKNAKPISYWKNTSDNAIIRSFIDFAGSTITKKLEILLSGGYIVQYIDEDITYDYLHSSEDNIWSVMYMTGYLTKVNELKVKINVPEGMIALVIPNAEIREIFETTIIKWFKENAVMWNRNELFNAVWNGKEDNVTYEMTKLLRRTISYHDYSEDFYHAFLAGIFAGAGYRVESNKEHGEGRSDVIVYDDINAAVVVFEAKYSKNLDTMQEACTKALEQIDAKMYAAELKDDYDKVICYGISFFKKRCLIRKKLDME